MTAKKGAYKVKEEKSPIIKVLNLYAGIGGNRKLWKNVEVTAVENNLKTACKYHKRFPYDTFVNGDAHSFLLENYKNYDFIWSSPPCQTHSRTNYFLKAKGIANYPDMRLYEEIIFLQTHFKGKWCVENVIPYYNPPVPPSCIIGRHYLWSNFEISKIKMPKIDIGKMCGKNQRAHNITLEERNAINSKLGLHVFNEAFKERKGVCDYV